MNCPDCLEYLQQRLDGASDSAPSGLQAHLASCPDCRAWFAAAQRLQDGLRCLTASSAPAHLTNTLVQSIVADQRRRCRLRRLVLGAAVAAGVCIALLGGYRLTHQPGPEPGPQAQQGSTSQGENQAIAESPAGPSLGRSVDAARSAMAALTGDLGSTARRLLGSAAIPLSSKSIGLPAVAELEEPLEPTARSLRESGRGVSVSLAAVTGSARRAVGYFLREIPGFPAGKKTGL